MAKIGVLGSGVVGETLANGFLKQGHDVMRGSREPSKRADWKKGAGAHARVATFAETATYGDVVVLAVKGGRARSVRRREPRGQGRHRHDEPNRGGASAKRRAQVLHHARRLAHGAPSEDGPEARFVKAFSCVGNVFMVDPDFGGQKPTMFICGNDEAAKQETTKILTSFGWETEDMGTVEAARAIEPLCMLWCIPGLRQNRWMHAFKLLKK